MTTSTTQIYIGGLRDEIEADDLKYEFKRFGAIAEFNFKGRCAFIEYEEPAGASDAVKDMDGATIGRSNVRLTVEHARK